MRYILALVALAGLAAADEVSEFSCTRSEPFGVARLTLRTLRAEEHPILHEHAGRALYPTHVVSDGGRQLDIYFLFHGREPLDVSVTLSGGQTHRARATPGPFRHGRRLNTWWKRYVKESEAIAREDAYPRVVRSYLLSMLARRIGKRAPDINYAWLGRSEVDGFLGLLLGTESIRIAAQGKTEAAAGKEAATQPLPRATAPPAVDIPAFREPPEDMLARRVPVECFYLRANHPADLAWFLRMLDDWGGNLRNLVAVRGFDYGLMKKLQKQLVIHMDTLAKLPRGEIEDVALIGTDSFLREGAAVGLLVRAAEHAPRLHAALARERTIESGDGTVRSYYVTDGAYHLITNSKALRRRFLETANGVRPLTAEKAFRYAGSRMETGTCFLYLSDAFFRNLVSPHYRVEMARRMRAAAEIEMVEIARLAAKAEGKRRATLHDLEAGGFLPRHFGERPDGSTVVMDARGIRDSMRGARGTFLAVPDVEIKSVTRSEAEAYRDFARKYKREWEWIDPVAVTVRRESAAKGRERIVFDIHIAPYARATYGMLATFLGKPDRRGVVRDGKDIVTLDVRAGFLGDGVSFVLGLRDRAPRYKINKDDIDFSWKGTPGYIASVPVQDLFFRKSVKRGTEVAVHSEWPGLAEELAAGLKFEKKERPAQLRLYVGDLAASKWAPLLNGMEYFRARAVSSGNGRFLDELHSQLHVPPANAKAVAARILDARLVCALGGRFQYAAGRFRTTAVRKNYQAPILRWFKGLDLEFTMTDDALEIRVALEVAPR